MLLGINFFLIFSTFKQRAIELNACLIRNVFWRVSGSRHCRIKITTRHKHNTHKKNDSCYIWTNLGSGSLLNLVVKSVDLIMTVGFFHLDFDFRIRRTEFSFFVCLRISTIYIKLWSSTKNYHPLWQWVNDIFPVSIRIVVKNVSVSAQVLVLNL